MLAQDLSSYLDTVQEKSRIYDIDTLFEMVSDISGSIKTGVAYAVEQECDHQYLITMLRKIMQNYPSSYTILFRNAISTQIIAELEQSGCYRYLKSDFDPIWYCNKRITPPPARVGTGED